MNTITLTLQLCEEDRARLDNIAQELRVISDTTELIRLGFVEGKTLTALPAVAAEQPEPQAETAPEENAPTEPQKAEDEPFVSQVTLADIQKKVVGLSTAGKKAEVKAVIQAYAPKVSAIPEDKLAEVMEKLTELEG